MTFTVSDWIVPTGTEPETCGAYKAKRIGDGYVWAHRCGLPPDHEGDHELLRYPLAEGGPVTKEDSDALIADFADLGHAAVRRPSQRETELHQQYGEQMSALEAEIQRLVRAKDAVLAERTAIWDDGHRAGRRVGQDEERQRCLALVEHFGTRATATWGNIYEGRHVADLASREKTPREWEEEKGIRVVDPDGWRAGSELGPKEFSAAITEGEFDRRVASSTVDHSPR